MSRAASGLLLALALVGAGAGAARAQTPPDARWQTLETAHFRVDYMAGLDSLARHAGAVAERAYARLSRQLTSPPAGRIELVLSDAVDYSNGATTPFPSNRIYLLAHPPVGDPELAYFPDWMELLVDHELTHAFHLDRTGKAGSVLRAVFGRLPVGWPLFPAVGTPSWNLEGTAVFYESHLTGQGRIYGSYHDMVLRTATLEGKFWDIDRLTGESPIWPGGSAAYIYGSFFLDWLAQRYGPAIEGRLVQATASQRIPSFATVAHRATGHSWPDLYHEWRDSLRARYQREAEAVRARGLTPVETLTRGGYYALYPRVSPDGRLVAFAGMDPQTALETRVYDVASGKVRRVSRRNSLGPAAWLTQGWLLTSQLELRDPYRVYSDLYTQRAGGGERRVTHSARLDQVDVGPDRRIVAVQDSAGLTRLVLTDRGAGLLTPLTPWDARYNWADPRFSPDGRRIAAARWTRGGNWDIVLLDPAGRLLTQITDDAAVDVAPAWSPDGRWLLWGSDRTGIPNIFAVQVGADANAAQLKQVTNVLGGAAYPDVSPDGRWLYFSGYHADGWHLERTRFEPGAFLEAPAARLPPPDTIGVLPIAAADTAASPARRYRALPTVLPTFWVPAIYAHAGRDFVGAATGGADAIGRHAWSALLAFDARHGGAEWQTGYEFAGLGVPVLAASSSRSFDRFRQVLNGNTFYVVRRQDDLSLAATFQRPRARQSGALSLGADLTRRHHFLEQAPANVALVAPDDRLRGLFAGLGWASYQAHPYSISREDGIAASGFARRRWENGAPPGSSGDYSEQTATLRGYRSLPLPGFAHHVLALRISGLRRGGPGAEPEDVGGASGQELELVGPLAVGTAGIFLPVRGYAEGVRQGTRAWSGSLEYRAPLALVGRGHGTSPYYLDRLSGDLFLDAGNASCPVVNAAGVTPNGFLCSAPGARPLVGTGGELMADARVLFPVTLRWRAGVGFPISQGGQPRGWITLGSAF